MQKIVQIEMKQLDQTDKNIANFKEAAQHAQPVENCHICLCQRAQVVMGAAPNV